MEQNVDTYPIAISVDVEDGINIAMRDIFEKQMPPTERVVFNTRCLLDLFEKNGVKATFFVLGQVAEHYPDIVREIDSKGHEIGVHGYDHYQFHTMDYAMARDQLTRAKQKIEDLIGKQVLGHRAPAFSIDETTKWALELLADLDFKYDSSIVPCRGPHYGWDGFPDEVVHIKTTSGKSILEIPMTTINLMGWKVSLLGGSYFRLLPYWITNKIILKAGSSKDPLLYLHPYEIDDRRYPDFYFEEMQAKSLLTRLSMRSRWIGRGTVFEKLDKVGTNYPTQRMVDIYKKNIDNDGLREYNL